MNTRKTSGGDLAILGGSPAFGSPLHVGRPNIGDRTALQERFSSVLDSRWLTNGGQQVQEFERRMAELTRARHCVATCNATVALEIAAKALGMQGEVIVPSMTFVATAHALLWQGIEPRFCDVDPRTHNLDLRAVESLITDRTTGIVAVHLWGRTCDVEGLRQIARRYHLKLLFDAAHATGCSHRGEPVGSFGDAEVFSFHATKVANSFEGGAITTNDDALAERIRLMHNFGFKGMDNVIELGTNGKMSEIAAAMGNVSLDSLEDFIAANRRNYLNYKGVLSSLPGFRMVEYDDGERNNYQYVVFEIDDTESGLDRDTLLAVLHAENIRARRYFWPGCHRMEPYRSLRAYAGVRLPETDEILSRVLVLPNGTTVSDEDVDIVCQVIRVSLENANSICDAMRSRSAAI